MTARAHTVRKIVEMRCQSIFHVQNYTNFAE